MLPSEYLAQGWCQGNSARNKRGSHILARDSKAKKWCFMGAMDVSGLGMGTEGKRLWRSYRDKALELLHVPLPYLDFSVDIPNWNDQPLRTQAEVVALAWRVEMALGLRPGAEVEPVVETETLELALVN